MYVDFIYFYKSEYHDIVRKLAESVTESENLGDYLKKIILLLLFGCVSLCSCEIRMETSVTTDDGVPAIVTTVISDTEAAEPQPYPVVINDTEIIEAPESVVSLSPSLTEILCEMGYGDKLTGRGSYCDYPTDISSVKDVGRPSKPDIDAIISLSPDVLFTATAIPTKDLYRLEESGISVVYIPYPRDMEQFENIYTAIGLVFEGKFDGEAAGEKAFSVIDSAFKESDISLGNFVYITEGLTVSTGDTFESSVLSSFGTNIAETGNNYGYEKEFLIEFQPDVIILNDNYSIDDLAADEIYSQLAAVNEGRVYSLSSVYFERPSGRLTEIVDSLKEIG